MYTSIITCALPYYHKHQHIYYHVHKHIIICDQHISMYVKVLTSTDTQNEFGNALVNNVKEIYGMDITAALYFGITLFIIVRTPEISRTEEMSEVIRYIKVHSGKFK